MTGTGALPYRFAPHERPLFPGGPFTPRHPGRRKAAYLAAALISGVVATLGSGLVSVNQAAIAGSAGLYAAEAAWLPAITVAMNATANLLLVKARTQFGIQPVTQLLLLFYALTALIQLLAPGFPAMAAVRAASGLAGGALLAITIFDLLQTVPAPAKPIAVGLAICISQFGPVLARLFPVEFLALGAWRGLSLVELILALSALLMLHLVRLPPSEKQKAFEPLDFVTMALAVPAMLLICGVLAQGRLLWWFDSPRLGWMLAASVPLLAGAILVERGRARPLLLIDWLSTSLMLRFALVALLVRFTLAEQTYGAVGLLAATGLNNDQLRLLFILVALAMLLGTIVMALLVARLGPQRLNHQVLAATLIIALAAWLDSHATNQTRPAQLYLSQALIGCGTCLFIAPALLTGVLQVLQRGGDHLVSVIVLFSTTQNLGGLAGAAFLGTYQAESARAHAAGLAEQLTAGNVALQEQLRAAAGALSGTLTDPAALAQQSAARLSQAVLREANILAFNDTFRLVALIALATATLIAATILFTTLRARRPAAETPS
ncbi:MAG TPA: MFS transporter [Allosphingosinicella sp.]|nr:MFS transporter [Allosphingosinicella sp.]